MNLLPEHFHFLRPDWFWALVPLLLVMGLQWKQKLMSRSWQSVVDAKLLPHLLLARAGKNNSTSYIMISLASLLSALFAIIALAGPVWNKLEQPVFRQQSALVILLDLSRSMDAADIKPSRLIRAKLKLHDILQRRKEGQTAIITYAANAFVVTPLTTDTKTISSQLAGLSTDLMPRQGSRADRAIEKGITLLNQAGMKKGVVMLVTDGVAGAPVDKLNDQINNIVSQGYRLQILGVGSEDGAPIPQETGGFFKDNQGNIILPKLDTASLQKIAHQGRGIYQSLSANDNDIKRLLAMVDSTGDTLINQDQQQGVDDMKSDQWQDQGYWLLLPLLLLTAFVFRRGYLFLLVIIVLPVPQPAYASEWTQLDNLWTTDDQRAQQAFNKGDTKKAAELFSDPQWRAAARYKSGEYDAALKEQEKLTQPSNSKSERDNAKNLYNKGNALAQLQRFPDALAAYEEALKHDPTLEDAKFNRDLIKKLMQQNQSNNKNKSAQQDKDAKQDKASQSDSSRQDENKQASDDKGQESDKDARQNQQQQADNEKSDQSVKQNTKQQDKNQKDDAAQAKKDLQQNNKKDEEDANEKQMAESEKNKSNKPDDKKSSANMMTQKEITENELNKETNQAAEQWLRRIPDDPAGLWRRKFLYQYQKQYQSQKEENKPW